MKAHLSHDMHFNSLCLFLAVFIIVIGISSLAFGKSHSAV